MGIENTLTIPIKPPYSKKYMKDKAEIHQAYRDTRLKATGYPIKPKKTRRDS